MPSKNIEKRREAGRRDYLRPGRKEAIIASNKVRRKKIRSKIREIKRQFGCSRCGYNECEQALEFHHREDEVKEFELGGMRVLDLAWSRIELEILKCDILCANCHRQKKCKCCN
jgi:hypothetical protein